MRRNNENKRLKKLEKQKQVFYTRSLVRCVIVLKVIIILLGGEVVTTPTFQLESTGSTPGRDI